VIEETAAHSGHLEIARELLDGKTRLGGPLKHVQKITSQGAEDA
jgi:Protein of unknown function (DUF664)